ncbi:sporulation initiation factor Spo0A C-terminal domain-containing protein [Christensenella timonensis]|uniref:sporulation initiation factor Spo0A C-terminal domain-containing protein n=1 Tax=Christensenella timonensis TaxID=1816678 RepID=UPI000835B32E|nr:sporulation initiation factor Spo0A C-terminal domain-containing protein [Christensenella timonensis]
MARFKRTLIVEQSKKYVMQIKEMLADVSDSFQSTTDGSNAISLYDQYNPDLVLVEAIMPGYDGFALMEHMLESDIIKIVLTSMNQELIIKKAFELNANYLFVKPYIRDVFVSRILEAADFRDMNRQTEVGVNQLLYSRISVSLKRLGIPANVQGYKLLRDALYIVCMDFSKTQAINKNIYQVLAEKHGTQSSCVERNIRHAIETAATRGDPDAFNAYFGYTVSSEKGKPTNGEFIATLADKLRLQDE